MESALCRGEESAKGFTKTSLATSNVKVRNAILNNKSILALFFVIVQTAQCKAESSSPEILGIVGCRLQFLQR